MKNTSLFLCPLFLGWFCFGCASINHTPAEFKKDFKKNNIRLNVKKSGQELSWLIVDQSRRCFVKQDIKEPGFKTTITFKSELKKQSSNQSEILIHRRLQVNGTFGKPIVGNSFVSIVNIKGSPKSRQTEVKAVCRQKKFCRAIQLWSLDKSKGCPSLDE